RSANPPAGGEIELSSEVTDLCPFIGNMTLPQFKQSSIVGPNGPAGGATLAGVQIALHPCVKSRCAQWSVEMESCAIRNGMDALCRLEVILAPLANFFGKK
ncbi:MAG: hypothetical protein ACREDF_06715, partial [Thermoplasmata archaeon]